jgi:hypothetical protein
MEDEIIDTAAPTVVEAPDRSAEIAAKLDAMDAEAKAAAEAPPADEAVLELPAEQPAIEPYSLALPLMLTDDEAEAHAPTLDSFAVAASAAGLDQSVAQSLAGVYASVSQALLPMLSRVNEANGETEFSDLTDRDEMTKVTLQALGADAPAIHAAASKYVKAHPALGAWLDDSYIGNSPAALVALALAQEGVFALDVDAARTALATLTSDPRGAFYHAGPGHVVAIVRASVLQQIVRESEEWAKEVDQIRIAEIKAEDDRREAAQQAEIDRRLAQERANEMAKTVAEAKLRADCAAKLKLEATKKAQADAADAAAVRKAKAWSTATSAAAAPSGDPRAEAAAMLAEKNGPLTNNGHPGHADAVRRFHQLTARL